MSKYIAVNALYEERDDGKPILRRAGEEIELPDDAGQRLLESGKVRELDSVPEPEPEGNVTPALPRPSKGASKSDWVTFANTEYGLNLNEAEVTRDETIALVEQAEKQVGA